MLVVSACATSPRPDPTGSAPSIPANANPITNITWTETRLPDGIGSESMFYGAAGGPKGFVIVGDTGALGFGGVALTSTDGNAWALVDDTDITPWSLEEVIATDAGYIAIGGTFGSGPSGWSSAILTSSDGRDWSVRHQGEGSISSVAAHGSHVVATTDGPAILVSDDAGGSWSSVKRSDVGLEGDAVSAVAVLGSGRWLAIGSKGLSAAAWVSDDGARWTPAAMEGADPVPGVKRVTTYGLVAGDAVGIASGTDDPELCDGDADDGCNHYGAAWSTEDGSTWRRLPKGTPPADAGGTYLWPAGPAGVLAGIASRQSANGWDWTPFPGPAGGDLASILALHGSTVVAAGITAPDDGPLLGIWVGAVTYAR